VFVFVRHRENIVSASAIVLVFWVCWLEIINYSCQFL